MIKALNVGGGPRFKGGDEWLNLDGALVENFAFTPTCRFPLEDDSLELVYSSHVLEHLDDLTVARVLDESNRVLQPNGRLLIKIPDFEAILAHYRANDWNYFTHWNLEKCMVPTLDNYGMVDSIATRAAYLFCGFWNREFGHLFKGYDAKRPDAYNGPAPMAQSNLNWILSLSSPHHIAMVFQQHVIENYIDHTFNHQNAWSRDEFWELLIGHGFSYLDESPSFVIEKYKEKVPDINNMRDISRYYEAYKGAEVAGSVLY